MSSGYDEDDDLRPFLEADWALPDVAGPADPDDEDERAYLLAGTPLLAGPELAVDSVVAAAHGADAEELGPDERSVLACAGKPVTLFDIVRRSGLSFGLVREIAGQLMADGLLGRRLPD